MSQEFSKVVFLDIDGVLNSSRFLAARGATDGEDFVHENDIDPNAVQLLNQIVARTDAKIVVSSTWRIIHRRVRLSEILKARGFTGHVIGTTPILHKSEVRYQEILNWLYEHPSVTRFVILDDSHDAGISMAPQFVQTDFEHGLQQEHVERACSILLKEED